MPTTQPGALVYGNSSGNIIPFKVAADGTVATTATLSGTVPSAETFHLVSAASTNPTSLKASAGIVYGWFVYNANASARKVAFHDTAGAPTAGANVLFALVLPPLSGANVSFPNGITFANGIAITTTTGLADADATAVAAADLVMNIWFI
jgi:hypothetical protein